MSHATELVLGIHEIYTPREGVDSVMWWVIAHIIDRLSRTPWRFCGRVFCLFGRGGEVGGHFAVCFDVLDFSDECVLFVLCVSFSFGTQDKGASFDWRYAKNEAVRRN